MIPVVVAEWTKLRTLPSTVWTLLIACIAALGGSVILTVASSSAPNAPFDPVTGIFIGWGEYPVLAVGILGALAVTNEYGNRMIRTTFTAVPQRLPVLGAKAGIVGGLVLIVMMALAWAAFAIAEIVRGIHHRPIPLTDPGVARSVAMAGPAMAAVAVLGTGIGALVRQTVAAVIAFTAVVFLPLVLLALPWRWADVIGQYGILAAGFQLASPIPHHDLLPVWAATLILIAWPLTSLIAAATILARRDA